MLWFRSHTRIHPAPDEAAKTLPALWTEREVYGPPSCHDRIGVVSLGVLYGSHSLMPSVAQERSFLSLVNVRPLTTFELCDAVSKWEFYGQQWRLTAPRCAMSDHPAL